MENSIARFLFQSRLTPHCTTGVLPAELLLNWRPRSLLVCLHLSVGDRARQNQERQTRGHDLQAWSRTLEVGERVLVKNFRSGHKWLAGVVTGILGPLTYLVQLEGGPEVRRHIDHLRLHSAARAIPETMQEDSIGDPDFEVSELEEATAGGVTDSTTAAGAPGSHADDTQRPTSSRRSTRVRNPPDRFMYPPM